MKPGWVTKRLDEVGTLQRGFDLPAPQRTPGRFPLITSSGPTDTHCEAKVKGPGVATGRSGSIGNVFYVEDDFWPLNTALYVKDFHGNHPRFIFYLLQHLGLGRFASGAGVPTLNRNDVHGEPVNIPQSLEEQRRIVTVLDEAFTGLARARANAEANLQNARELFLRCIEVDFETLSKTYPRLTVGQIAVIKGGKRLPKGAKTVSTKTPFPYISIQDFNDEGSVNTDGIKYLEPGVREVIKNYIIREEDLYISIAGTIGKTGIVPPELDGANLTENAARMVFKEGIDNEYVYLFTLTADFQDQAGLNTRTAAQPKLALERLKTISVPIAPPIEQTNLVCKFQMLREQTKEAEDRYRKKLSDVVGLRQSLLQRAFAGELT